jgi:2,4-dienoyl-CoA reductase-like NADH-dependent reductase (Old Yellow Enzyme family)
LEVIDETIKVFGADRVGIKLSPAGYYSDVFDSDPIKLYTYLFKEFNKRKLGYIELKKDSEPENFANFGYPASLT